MNRQAKFPYIKPCKSHVKIIWLPGIYITKFIISLKEAIEYIWHIIITVIAHEYTHHVYIYLTNRLFLTHYIYIIYFAELENTLLYIYI